MQQLGELKVVGPAHYAAEISRGLLSLEQIDPTARELIRNHLSAVYATAQPPGIGFYAGVAFISDRIPEVSGHVWPQQIAYMVAMARLSKAVEDGQNTYRWSTARKEADQLERNSLLHMQGNISE
ncbi:MAG: hypothetical protein ACR2IE_14770 [Candidatus Sumerlaeaceae bacterium]